MLTAKVSVRFVRQQTPIMQFLSTQTQICLVLRLCDSFSYCKKNQFLIHFYSTKLQLLFFIETTDGTKLLS